MNYINTIKRGNIMKDFELKCCIINGVEKWYFYYSDGIKWHKMTCRNCQTKDDAEVFVEKAKEKLRKKNQYLIRNIAADMFLYESQHLKRYNDFGKKLCSETINQKRQFIELIINQFGDELLNELPVSKIERYLLNDKRHSGSWKNFYLETFLNIYDESIWKCEHPVTRPKFQKFARNSVKPDVFTEKELNDVLDRNIWDSYTEWLLFCLTAACGLRLGEARAVQVRQFKFHEGILVVDGFLKGNGFRTNYNKKGNAMDRKIRCVPVPYKVLSEIAYHVATDKMNPDDYLFLDENGRTYTNSHLEHTFKIVLKRSGIKLIGKKYVPHSLRFTYVTRMRTVLSVDDVRKVVGHSSTDMTEYYTRIMIPEMCETVKPMLNVVNSLFDFENL